MTHERTQPDCEVLLTMPALNNEYSLKTNIIFKNICYVFARYMCVLRKKFEGSGLIKGNVIINVKFLSH